MTKRDGQNRLRVVPCSVGAANEYVDRYHRHHGPIPARSYRYAVAVVDETGLVRGVATIGTPVGANRMADGALVAEVSRVATDGCENACSALYGAAARVAKAAGYVRIITYILDSESGTSLKASGWIENPGMYGGQTWTNHPRPGRDLHPVGPKGRWSLDLHPYVAVRWPEVEDGQLTMVEP